MMDVEAISRGDPRVTHDEPQVSEQTGPSTPLATAQLTALWALSEGGLGGILHATRLPFRGVILACIAAISICLIARSSRRRTEPLRAAIVVLAVKAVLAPHSLGTAHLAVLNQALLGTACMVLLGPGLIGCVLTGALCLIETSLHPLIWTTVLGNVALGSTDFWAEVSRLLERTQLQLLDRVVVEDPARWVILLLIGVHAAFGILAGWVAWRLPRVGDRILSRHERLASSRSSETDGPGVEQPARRPRWVRWARAGIVIVAVFVLAMPAVLAAGQGPWYLRIAIAIVRVAAAVAVVVFLVRPLVGYVIERALRRSRRQQRLAESMASVRAMQAEAVAIWRQSARLPMWRRLPHCLSVLFAGAIAGRSFEPVLHEANDTGREAL